MAHFWVTDKLSVIREVLAAEFALASPSAAQKRNKTDGLQSSGLNSSKAGDAGLMILGRKEPD